MTVSSPQAAQATHRPPGIDQAWLDLVQEPILDADRPIIDPHHHLWARETQNYLEAESLADFGGGHRIVATVFVECWSAYRTDGPEHLRCIGETAFVAGMAGRKHLSHGVCDLAAGIVGHADLTAGDLLDGVLQAHIEAGRGRFRGIRHAVQFDASGSIPVVRKSTPHLLRDAAFQDGVRRLGARGLVFDAWLYQTQLDELVACARAAPDTRIVLNHLGGPLATGAYADRPDEVAAEWRRGMTALAGCLNLVVKLGGLGMATAGHGFSAGARPPGSETMAEAYRPQVMAAIELFGPERCMFESNFPVDKVSGSYAVLWNAFKRIAASFSDLEKDALFRGVAARTYGLTGIAGEGETA